MWRNAKVNLDKDLILSRFMTDVTRCHVNGQLGFSITSRKDDRSQLIVLIKEVQAEVIVINIFYSQVYLATALEQVL